MGDAQDAPLTPELALSVWNLEHPVALTGFIELDQAGIPMRIGLPDTLPRF
ncbi:hypothetical protein [Azohydromonas lata]|uniref:Uncharacterized protein n=1 Tax=Azohydromonas lata TaxID=45677 RepID=A0ABU5I7J6_9BURK|nr:hypothetical protein [Azohydromonas lata]MDZ5455074.1 hypothetical protein [Azohydromonas lata]